MRILVIEDNEDLAANIMEFLSARGHVMDSATDGVTGLHLAVVHEFDAIVLDLMLPGIDGFALCARLREEADKQTPILMLTARDTLEDKLAGFSSGADDYLIKPFSLLELEARLTALGNRGPRRSQHLLRVGDLTLDLDTWQAERAGQRIGLTPTALRLLETLMRASPKLVRRAELEAAIWGDHPPDSEALRTHIHALRAAIDKPFASALLHTVPTMGYRLVDPDAA
ncbi:response regulator transcription factor [Salinisphaera orenii]|uniref:XRE family transcriptional regulator n=1 Tax=Salinisphaera orenii YIM 95161 TaxID=1051139 RepID=A0A423Q035_9GAMM|nr:response regulator transcription factor [Salinisphaera halophila]ROO31208.1 XRE family transcriptional regulator [Salinisphaera halophila YIM 95161]